VRITWNLAYRLGLGDFTRVCVGVNGMMGRVGVMQDEIDGMQDKGMTGRVDVMQDRLLSASCCHSSAERVCACVGAGV